MICKFQSNLSSVNRKDGQLKTRKGFATSPLPLIFLETTLDKDDILSFESALELGKADIFSSESALGLGKADILSSENALELGKANILSSESAVR